MIGTVYAEEQPSLTELMDKNQIVRTPLVQPGKTYKDLADGIYPLTGGFAVIDKIGNGDIRLVGIMVNDFPFDVIDNNYNRNNIIGNRNFGCVLYELKKSGITFCNSSNIWPVFSDTPHKDHYMKYLNSYKGTDDCPKISLTKKLINGLASGN